MNEYNLLMWIKNENIPVYVQHSHAWQMSTPDTIVHFFEKGRAWPFFLPGSISIRIGLYLWPMT